MAWRASICAAIWLAFACVGQVQGLGINCRGSGLCPRATFNNNNGASIIQVLRDVVWASEKANSTVYRDGDHIVCLSQNVPITISPSFTGPPIDGFSAGASISISGSIDEGGICLFPQGTSLTLGQIRPLTDAVLDHKCTTCGSVPIHFVDQGSNDPSSGILTFNYVAAPTCDRNCISDIGSPKSGSGSGSGSGSQQASSSAPASSVVRAPQSQSQVQVQPSQIVASSSQRQVVSVQTVSVLVPSSTRQVQTVVQYTPVPQSPAQPSYANTPIQSVQPATPQVVTVTQNQGGNGGGSGEQGQSSAQPTSIRVASQTSAASPATSSSLSDVDTSDNQNGVSTMTVRVVTVTQGGSNPSPSTVQQQQVAQQTVTVGSGGSGSSSSSSSARASPTSEGAMSIKPPNKLVTLFSIAAITLYIVFMFCSR